MRFCVHVGTPLTSSVYLFFLFVFIFDILPSMCLEALWSPAGKGLTTRPFCMCCFLVLMSRAIKRDYRQYIQ